MQRVVLLIEQLSISEISKPRHELHYAGQETLYQLSSERLHKGGVSTFLTKILQI